VINYSYIGSIQFSTPKYTGFPHIATTKKKR